MFQLEGRVAVVVAVALGLAGLVCFSAYPLARIRDKRTESDIARAQVPLLMEPMDANRIGTGSRFDVQVPGDEQWRRIVERLGRPEFVVTLVIYERQTRPPTMVTNLSELVAVQRNGVDVATVMTSAHLESALLPTAVDGLAFAAASGDRLRIQVRGDRPIAEGERLILMPKWTKSSVLAWGEGASAEMFIGQFGGLLVGVVGALLIWSALIVAWGRPSEAA